MRPFEKIGTYTTFPNEILDHIMPACGHTVWKVICATVRQTLGWHVDVAPISVTRYMQLTGINSRGTVQRALHDAVEQGYLVKIPNIRINEYKLNFAYETVPSKVSEEGAVPLEGTPTVPLEGTIKESTKDIKDSSPSPKEKKKSVYVQAMEDLELVFATARSPRKVILPSWENATDARASMVRWRRPIKRIWQACDEDVLIATRYIKQAVKHSKSEGLTITAPASIIEVCMDMILDGPALTPESVKADEQTGGRW